MLCLWIMYYTNTETDKISDKSVELNNNLTDEQLFVFLKFATHS